MDRGACWATVHGVAKSWTQLSNKGHTQETPRVTKEESDTFNCIIMCHFFLAKLKKKNTMANWKKIWCKIHVTKSLFYKECLQSKKG